MRARLIGRKAAAELVGDGVTRRTAEARRGAGEPARPMALVGIALLSVTGGCTGIDGAELAEFRPLPGGTFEYRAATTMFYGPEDYGWSEGQRLAWLKDYLRLNAMCPNGYWLTSRTVLFQYQS